MNLRIVLYTQGIKTSLQGQNNGILDASSNKPYGGKINAYKFNQGYT